MRVLLSIAIGFVLVVGYWTLNVTLYKFATRATFHVVTIPLSLPEHLLELFFARADILNFERSHWLLYLLSLVLSNVLIYSISIFVILSFIGRSKREPETVTPEPPPPPEF